ncbi:MAG: TerB family tellurite resistance protein [Ardenticatenaceae bacterium]|nr:TerB family tellurite resistance protein [Ardenticatenaceae bacterium]MCB9442941.1 TerB family tellurite resistance protein [Ardenticatenaceae bacterium]
MPEEKKKHPLEEYSENEQVAYLSILSAVCYVDKEFGDKEKRQLDSLLAQLNISDVGKAKIYSSVFNLQHEDKLANLEAVQNLGNTELKYTLISDLCLFSLVDAKFTDEEYQYILGIGEVLGITQEQVDAIKSVQEDIDRIKDIPSNSERFKQVIKDGAANLAGVGVPIAAIAASGSVFGLSAAGMTSGLAALGALVGGGMLAGVVIVVPAIAVGTAYGVKKLIDVVWRDNEHSDDEKTSQEKGQKWSWTKKL